jgi:hypothetical protein
MTAFVLPFFVITFITSYLRQSTMLTESRQVPKRGVAKDGNKPERARRGAKAGAEAVDSVIEEGRVAVAPPTPTEAATVAVAETAAAEKEGDVVIEKAI